MQISHVVRAYCEFFTIHQMHSNIYKVNKIIIIQALHNVVLTIAQETG